MSIPASFHNLPGWQRQVADRVNPILTEITNDVAKLTYAGNAGKVIKVNSAADGVEFGTTDQWTYIRLSADFSTTSTTAVDITGLAFTPAANTNYEFEATLLCRSTAITDGVQPGLAWPTGGTDGVVTIRVPTSFNASREDHGNIAAALLSGASSFPSTTNSYGATVRGMFIAGATPSGTIKLQLASEAGSSVTVKAGSFLRYRTFS